MKPRRIKHDFQGDNFVTFFLLKFCKYFQSFLANWQQDFFDNFLKFYFRKKSLEEEGFYLGTIPTQSATLTAPFTQKGPCAVRKCVPFPLTALVSVPKGTSYGRAETSSKSLYFSEYGLFQNQKHLLNGKERRKMDMVQIRRVL